MMLRMRQVNSERGIGGGGENSVRGRLRLFSLVAHPRAGL
jgi:hypothetical protein